MGNQNVAEGDGEGATVWVCSDVAADGNYVLVINVGDHARPLDRPAAFRYAAAILAACHRAAHDAAIIAQMTGKLGLPLEHVAGLISGLRADRPPIDHDATAPLRVEPGVSSRTRRPFLTVHVDGREIGRWDVADGRSHAMHVLEGLEGVDLDAAYRRHLVGTVGVDDDRARQIVHDLTNFANAMD